jgi:hypothetical protein
MLTSSPLPVRPVLLGPDLPHAKACEHPSCHRTSKKIPYLASGAADSIPSRLTAQDFWRISSSMSEPDGTFHSENLVSNEILFQAILPELARTALAGRAYVGVGSEQNFTYISALRPKVAFIVDIRRGNLDLHLVYKALFELSADRADFVSRLFSRLRPAGLTRTSTAAEIFTAFEQARPSEALYAENLRAIERHLTSTRRFALLPGDHDGIAHVYRSWFDGGPDLRYEAISRPTSRSSF